jgi:hypothetical protein
VPSELPDIARKDPGQRSCGHPAMGRLG